MRGHLPVRRLRRGAHDGEGEAAARARANGPAEQGSSERGTRLLRRLLTRRRAEPAATVRRALGTAAPAGHMPSLRLWRRRGRTITVPAASEDDQREWARELAGLLCEVGVEMLRAGIRTEQAEAGLRDVAARYGVPARCFIVPTGLFVRVGGGRRGSEGELDFAPVDGGDLRLDQIEALEALLARMRAQVVPFDEVRAELTAMRAMPERYSPATTVGGHLLLTVGLGAVQHASPPALLGYLVLGAFVGVLRLAGLRFALLRPALPVLAAVLVTGVSLRWAGPLLHEQPARLFVPPLIAFLPGAALTMGALEVAWGAVLSGIGRLAGAFNQLLLLAFGIFVGTDLVAQRSPDGPAPETLGAWAGWCGVLLLGVGFVLYQSAHAGVLGWLLGALLAEHGVQVLGSLAVSSVLGAFAAGAALPLLTSWVGRRSHVPDQVVFLPCFWLLVPGSTGLRGVSDLLVEHRPGSLAILMGTVVTVVAVALGVLVGAGALRHTRLELGPPDGPARARPDGADASGEEHEAAADGVHNAGAAGKAGREAPRAG